MTIETLATCTQCGFDVTGMGRCPRCGSQVSRPHGTPTARFVSNATWRSKTNWDRLSLTPRMQKVLSQAVVDEGTAPVAEGASKALAVRGLCSADGALTPAGRVCGISLLPLATQCKVLGLELQHMRCGHSKSPELALMETYASASHPCCFTEGGILFVALYSLCFEQLLKLGNAKWGNAQYSVSLFGKARTPVQSWMYSSFMVYQEFMSKTPDLEARLLEDIACVSVAQAMTNFEVLQSWQVSETWFPHGYVGLTADLVRSVLELLPRQALVEVCRLFFSDPYAYVKGWPDLTLVESGAVRFVEVKTTDRLHRSQIITIPAMKAAGLTMIVARVER